MNVRLDKVFVWDRSSRLAKVSPFIASFQGIFLDIVFSTPQSKRCNSYCSVVVCSDEEVFAKSKREEGRGRWIFGLHGLYYFRVSTTRTVWTNNPFAGFECSL